MMPLMSDLALQVNTYGLFPQEVLLIMAMTSTRSRETCPFKLELKYIYDMIAGTVQRMVGPPRLCLLIQLMQQVHTFTNFIGQGPLSHLPPGAPGMMYPGTLPGVYPPMLPPSHHPPATYSPYPLPPVSTPIHPSVPLIPRALHYSPPLPPPQSALLPPPTAALLPTFPTQPPAQPPAHPPARRALHYSPTLPPSTSLSPPHPSLSPQCSPPVPIPFNHYPPDPITLRALHLSPPTSLTPLTPPFTTFSTQPPAVPLTPIALDYSPTSLTPQPPPPLPTPAPLAMPVPHWSPPDSLMTRPSRPHAPLPDPESPQDLSSSRKHDITALSALDARVERQPEPHNPPHTANTETQLFENTSGILQTAMDLTFGPY